MLLDEFLSVVSDSCNIDVYDEYGYNCFAEYDGRNSIPAVYGDIEVQSITPEGNAGCLWFHVYLGMSFEDVLQYVSNWGTEDDVDGIRNLMPPYEYR